MGKANKVSGMVSYMVSILKRSRNSSLCQQELWITLHHRPQGFGVKALMFFWKVAVISIGSCCVKLQECPAQILLGEGFIASRETRPHMDYVSLARNMKPGTRAGVREHSTSLLGYVFKSRVIRSEITEWYEVKGCTLDVQGSKPRCLRTSTGYKSKHNFWPN